ncbi:hypothetical protein HK097_006825, partial [Rhizophlyctis rosea]
PNAPHTPIAHDLRPYHSHRGADRGGRGRGLGRTDWGRRSFDGSAGPKVEKEEIKENENLKSETSPAATASASALAPPSSEKAVPESAPEVIKPVPSATTSEPSPTKKAAQEPKHRRATSSVGEDRVDGFKCYA